MSGKKAPGRPCSCPHLKGAYKKDGDRLFSRACCDKARGNGSKLKEGRFRLDTRKKFFTPRVLRPWHRLLREAVDAPSLEVFKARLDRALSNLVQWKVSLAVAGGWNWMIYKVPSNPSCSTIKVWLRGTTARAGGAGTES